MSTDIAIIPGADVLRPTKVPPTRVPSDAFTVEQNGVTYRPHAGEWVEFRSTDQVGDFLFLQRSRRISQEIAALADPDAAEHRDRFERMNVEMCRRAAAEVLAWNWTDDAGRPYPSPPSPEDMERLSNAELMYILTRGRMGGAELDPNAGGAGSTTTSTRSSEEPAQTVRLNRASRRMRG